jgi:hypothetical protein
MVLCVSICELNYYGIVYSCGFIRFEPWTLREFRYGLKKPCTHNIKIKCRVLETYERSYKSCSTEIEQGK